jgi:hypothetical protein
MLRISSATEAGSLIRLKAEGTIVGDWVPLLEAECLRHMTARRLVELDVADVSFVDREGVVMVQGLLGRGVQVVGASALVEALLRQTEDGDGAQT